PVAGAIVAPDVTEPAGVDDLAGDADAELAVGADILSAERRGDARLRQRAVQRVLDIGRPRIAREVMIDAGRREGLPDHRIGDDRGAGAQAEAAERAADRADEGDVRISEARAAQHER